MTTKTTKPPSPDVWHEYNHKMKQLRQHGNDNFIRIPRRVSAVSLMQNKQMELVV